jgi:hypothetical protein
MSIPTQTQSDLAAIVSCIRLLSHIATKENCAAHPGLYRAVVQATAGLRNIHDILSAPEGEAEEGARRDAASPCMGGTP